MRIRGDDDEMTFEEKLIEEAKDAIAAEIHQTVPSKQLIDYESDKWNRIGEFQSAGKFVLYHLDLEHNDLYAVQRNGVTLMWLSPESAEELADMINDHLGRR